ncbi:ankyrin repeat-containing domain protein [Aspergillus californicus]
MEYMASKYSFEETRALYGKYFARWGFQKNQKISPSDGIFIGRRINKRKQMFDNDSEVYVNDMTHVSTFNSLIVPGGRSHQLLPHVCTPVSPRMRLSWNTSLPWLRFSKLLQPTRCQDLPWTSTLAVTSPRDTNLISYTVNEELFDRLKSIVPWSRLSQPTNVHIATRFYESKQSTLDTFSLEMFLLSNNLVSHGPQRKPSDSMRAHDRRVLMLRTSGWNNATQFRTLLSANEPTAGAIAENIIGIALDAGMNPNCPIDTVYHGPLTPLQYLATSDDGLKSDAGRGGDNESGLAKLIGLFLHHGADVDLSYNGTSPLHDAVKAYNSYLIELFISHGAQVTPACLVAAAGKIRNPKLFSQLLRSDTDVNTRSHKRLNPLVEAARHGNVNIIELLISRGADVNALVRSDLTWQDRWGLGVTTVLGHAVVHESLEVVGALLGTCPNVNPELDGLPFLSLVLLAVQHCRYDQQILERLLRAGIDQVPGQCGKRSLVEQALQYRNIGACEVLLRYGAMINRPLYTKEQTTSALVCAILCGATEFAIVLIMKGARLNDVYTDSPGTVLGAAIEMGDVSLIQSLQSAGVAVVGSRVSQIGNLKTAEYLEESGILGEILKVCRVDILAAALRAKNDDLVRKLLPHNLDLNSFNTNTNIDGWLNTPLQAAIWAGSAEFVYDMLDLGAKVTDCDLAAAIDRGGGDYLELLRCLLIKVHERAPTAVSSAVLHDCLSPDSSLKPLKLLLTSGVDPTGTPAQAYPIVGGNRKGLGLHYEVETVNLVLELVSRYGSTAMLEDLFKASHWDSKVVDRALTVAMYFSRYQIYDLEITVRFLNCDYDDGSGSCKYEVFNPLQLAVEHQQVSLVQRLATRGNLDVKYLGEGIGRRTALHHAVENGNMELINLLIRQGGNINIGPATDGRATALQIASIQGYLGIARRLIGLGADINAAPATMNGRAALEGAAEHVRIDMLHMLLDKGASVTGDDGERQNGHLTAAKLLISFEPRGE